MQIKGAMRYHLIPVRMAKINNTRNNRCWQGYRYKDTVLYTVGGSANWYSCCGRQYGGTSNVKK